MTPAVRIRATSPKGHRRSGLRHPPTEVLHPPGSFTIEEIEALQADPRLLVEVAGGLAMGALTGPEIAAVMGGDTVTGGHFADWQPTASAETAATAEPDKPQSATSAGIEAGGEAAASTPAASPIVGQGDAVPAEGGSAEPPTTRPTAKRTRKGGEA